MGIRKEVKPHLHTHRYVDLDIEVVDKDECLIFPLVASEPRAQIKLWDQIGKSGERNCVVIKNIERDKMDVIVNGGAPVSVFLTQQAELLNLLPSKKILVDISELPHHVWAPILRMAYSNKLETRFLYAEPEAYTRHVSPASDSFFDLSVEFEGLSPLPGFVQLSEPPESDQCLFVAFLGFEGNRPRSLAYNFDRVPKVVPIVGLPGFQVEFPSYTITCNQELLDEFQAHHHIQYSKASCPFSAYNALKEIQKDHSEYYMYIAPVGTKPHSLGAILYSLENPLSTEILFDHPVNKVGRTKGVGVIHVYHFGKFDGH